MKLNKEQLNELYIDKKLSIKQISLLLNVSVGCVYNFLKRFDIKTRNVGDVLRAKYKPGEHPNCGKKHKQETLENFSKNRLGKKRSQTTKQKLKKSWTEERKSDQSKRLSGIKPKNLTYKGRKHSDEYKKRMSNKFSGKNNPMFGKTGAANPCWIPPDLRKTTLYKQIRNCHKMKTWRTTIFVRDNYTCTSCAKQGGRLHADHIKQFAIILLENDVKTLYDALKCEELWKIENGRTLCVECHIKTDTYCKRISNGQCNYFF